MKSKPARQMERSASALSLESATKASLPVKEQTINEICDAAKNEWVSGQADDAFFHLIKAIRRVAMEP